MPKKNKLLYEICSSAASGPAKWMPAGNSIQEVLWEFLGIEEQKLDNERIILANQFRTVVPLPPLYDHPEQFYITSQNLKQALSSQPPSTSEDFRVEQLTREDFYQGIQMMLRDALEPMQQQLEGIAGEIGAIRGDIADLASGNDYNLVKLQETANEMSQSLDTLLMRTPTLGCGSTA